MQPSQTCGQWYVDAAPDGRVDAFEFYADTSGRNERHAAIAATGSSLPSAKAAGQRHDLSGGLKMRPESLEYSYWDGASSLQNIAATVPDNVLGSARFAYFRPYSANVSGEPLKPMQKLCRIAGWALLVAIVVLSVVPPHYRPGRPPPMTRNTSAYSSWRDWHSDLATNAGI